LSIGLWWFCGDGGCLEEIGDKYANQQACERDLLMRGTDEHHYGEHNRARLVYGSHDFWLPNGPDS
jgi:hypothetical protein